MIGGRKWLGLMSEMLSGRRCCPSQSGQGRGRQKLRFVLSIGCRPLFQACMFAKDAKKALVAPPAMKLPEVETPKIETPTARVPALDCPTAAGARSAVAFRWCLCINGDPGKACNKLETSSRDGTAAWTRSSETSTKPPINMPSG